MKVFNVNKKRSLISSGLFKKCGILVLSLALAGCGCGSSKKEDKQSQAVSSVSKSEQLLSEASSQSTESDVSKSEQESKVQSNQSLEVPSSITEERAKEIVEFIDYLAYQDYQSEEGIEDMLRLSDFSSPEIEYAKDYLKTLKVDYYKNALESALKLKEENGSEKGIRSTLFSILKFTPSQVNYAMENLGETNFNESALKTAQRLKDIGLSVEDIRGWLRNDLFTPEEAQYAIDHLDN